MNHVNFNNKLIDNTSINTECSISGPSPSPSQSHSLTDIATHLTSTLPQHQVTIKRDFYLNNHQTLIEDQKHQIIKDLVIKDLVNYLNSQKIQNPDEIEIIETVEHASSSIIVEEGIEETKAILEKLKPDTVEEGIEEIKANSENPEAKLPNREKRKKLSRQKRMAEQLKIKNEKQELQSKINAENRLKEFQLKRLNIDQFIKTNTFVETIEDPTKLAEDFRLQNSLNKKKLMDMGKHHVYKRLNFFLIMSQYIEEKSPYLQNMNFPSCQKNQFLACAYTVSSSFKKNYPSNMDFERAHVSLLNKIVVEDSSTRELFKMEGPLTIVDHTVQKTIKTTLHTFFNICDFAPATINAIDWFEEYYLRNKTSALFEAIKTGQISPMQATDIVSREYGWRLIELQDRIQAKNSHAPKMDDDAYDSLPNEFQQPGSFSLAQEFKANMKKILEDKVNAKLYIDGMLQANIKFRRYILAVLNTQFTASKPKLSLAKQN